MAAGMLLDRGHGKAAQIVALDGQVRQLIEVKLHVVDPARNTDGTQLENTSNIKLLEHDARIDNPLANESSKEG